MSTLMYCYEQATVKDPVGNKTNCFRIRERVNEFIEHQKRKQNAP